MMDRPQIAIRDMTHDDCATISRSFAAQSWTKPPALFRLYLTECDAGLRAAQVAECAGQFAGYVTIVWKSEYAPFRDAGVPEIVDLNVLQVYQRKGIATALMEVAERRIAGVSDVAGIGVGVTADYGPAQVMYCRRGYAPNGRGLHRAGEPVERGEQITVDDTVTLYLVKRLR